jgi:hypothetical protein
LHLADVARQPSKQLFVFLDFMAASSMKQP